MGRPGEMRVLSWLLLPATLALLLSALSLPRHGWTGLTLQGDRIVTIEPGSPGARAGLRPGDLLHAPGERSRLLALDPLGVAEPGRPLVLERERLGVRTLVWLAPEALPSEERRFKSLLFAVACGFLLLAGWVWSERRDRLTAVFFLLGLCFAGWLAPPPRMTGGAAALHQLSLLVVQLFIPALFSHFFSLFPEPGPRPRAAGWVRACYAAGAISLLAWVVVLVEDELGGGRLAPLALPWLTAAASLTVAAGFLGGLVLFAAALARAQGADARRRLRVAFLGTLLGAAPFALLVAARNLAPDLRLPGERLFVLATLLMPASFAWAIAVHRVFDFRVALRAGLALAIAGAAAAAIAVAGEMAAPTLLPGAAQGVAGASLAFLVLVASLAGPARPWLSRLGERMVPIAGERTLAGWSPSPDAMRDPDPARVFEEACEVVQAALRLDGVTAMRLEPAEAVAHAGARRTPELGAGFADALARARGPVPLPACDLSHEDRDSLELAGVHWLVPVPGEPRPAVLLLGRRLTGPWLDRHEVRELEQLADRLAVALEHGQLRRERHHRGAMERELAEAHVVQMHRLPRRLPVLPTLDCAAVTLSTEAVGGDYYDVIETGPREFVLAVGDAAGHGVPAALVMAGVQARFRNEATRTRHPGDLLGALNRDLVALDQPEKFMGLLCARVDAAAATVRFANGGLTPPLVWRAARTLEEHLEGGMLLGVSAEARYETATVELKAGDVVLLYTDGLTEAMRQGQPFGTDGVGAVLAAHGHRRAGDILEALLRAVRAHADEALDDLTVVVLKQLSRPAFRNERQGGLKSAAAPAETNG